MGVWPSWATTAATPEMGVESTVVLVVLCGALLHASWNIVVKGAADKEVEVALVHFAGAIAALPLVFWLGLPPGPSWPYLLASLCVHVAYYITLAGAYKHGDLSATYPIMRGTAPVLVALGSTLLLSESLSTTAWLGILAVTTGVMWVGLSRPAEALHHHRAVAFALVNAVVICCYTLIDGVGVRVAKMAGGEVASYVVMLFVLDGVPYPLLLAWQREREGRPAIWAQMRQRWWIATFGGLASMGSYWIALWAMTRAPVAVVSALRETSVLFGTAMSVWILNERFGWQRGLGAVAIVAGVVLLRLS